MAVDIFSGDPYIALTADGAEINFVGGQPIMDTGLENQVGISLFTGLGWWGNVIEERPERLIGSDYEEQTKQPITVEMLKTVQKSAISAVKAPVFKDVNASIDEFGGGKMNVTIKVTPPSGNEQEVLLSKNGENWINQRDSPANLK